MDMPDKILIVDDEESYCAVLARTLAECGYVCETAGDGEQGLAALRRGNFAVALIDLEMPGMNGMELLRAMSASTIDAVPVILTGNGDIFNAVETMKLGAYDFIQKPSANNVLYGAVKRAVDHRRMLLHAQALGAMVERWETVFDAWPDIIVVLDLDRRILLCNITLAHLLGVGKNELIGRPCHEAICFDGHSPEDCPFQAKPDEETGLTEFFHTKWGIHYEMTSAVLKDRTSRAWGSLHIARDITESKKAGEKLAAYHEQLHSLASEFALTEARERQRFAVDLHDGIGQTLAMAKLRLDILRGSLSSAHIGDDLLEIAGLIEKTISSTRSLTFELSPPILYEIGLEAAVASLLEKTRRDHGILTGFEDGGQPLPLDRDLRVFLYQAIRELLINAIKHAKANRINVSIHREEGTVRVTVEDNGIGFDAKRLQSDSGRNRGFGLFNIRERFDHLNGEFRIDSKSGQGTKIVIVVPITVAHSFE